MTAGEAPTTARPSPLIMGCMQIGGDWTDAPLAPETITNAVRCVEAARRAGIAVFDHADIYCRGKSETAFGHVWSELGIRRDDVVIQTKCGIRSPGDPTPEAPHRYDLSYEHILTSVQRSLERLRTDHVDVLLLHRPDMLADPDEIARAFDDLRARSLVRRFGVSNANRWQMELLQASLPEPLVANQLEFSLLHTDLIDEGVTVNHGRQRTSFRGDGTLEYCRVNTVEVQAWSPLAKGVLGRLGPQDPERFHRAARELSRLASVKGTGSESIMLAWVLRHPAGLRPVIGTTKPERIAALSHAAAVRLTREEWYALMLAARGQDIP